MGIIEKIKEIGGRRKRQGSLRRSRDGSNAEEQGDGVSLWSDEGPSCEASFGSLLPSLCFHRSFSIPPRGAALVPRETALKWPVLEMLA